MSNSANLRFPQDFFPRFLQSQNQHFRRSALDQASSTGSIWGSWLKKFSSMKKTILKNYKEKRNRLEYTSIDAIFTYLFISWVNQVNFSPFGRFVSSPKSFCASTATVKRVIEDKSPTRKLRVPFSEPKQYPKLMYYTSNCAKFILGFVFRGNDQFCACALEL